MEMKLLIAVVVTLATIQLSVAYEEHWQKHIVSQIIHFFNERIDMFVFSKLKGQTQVEFFICTRAQSPEKSV